MTETQTGTTMPEQIPQEAPTFDHSSYNEQVGKLIDLHKLGFERVIKPFVYINTAFVFLTCLELLTFVVFFPSLAESALLAVTISGFFFTLFAYFAVRLYFKAKRPTAFATLPKNFLDQCKTLLHFQEGIPEHHMALANAANRLSNALTDDEYTFYSPPKWLDILSSSLSRFSCWWHWWDVFHVRELLFLNAIDEQIKLVKLEPTNLEVHAALANSYVMLSSLYSDPRRAEDSDPDRWIPPERYSVSMQERFKHSASCAMEELKILNEYAPNDPWIHAQLAYSYRDLQMPEEEIKEYLAILRLRPEDKDTLFRLGLLYFQLGQNAQGLRIYEQLRQSHYKKASALIKFYGGKGIAR